MTAILGRSNPGNNRPIPQLLLLLQGVVALVLLLLSAVPRDSLALNIGVHNDENIRSFLSSLNSSEAKSRFGLATGVINATEFNVGPDPETVAQMRSYIDSVRSSPPDLIIGTYNGTIAAIAGELGIPYYCTSQSQQSRVLADMTFLNGSSLLLMNSYTEDMVFAAQRLTNSIIQRRTLIVLADDVSDSVNFLLNALSNQELHLVVLGNSSDGKWIRESLHNASLRANISGAVFQTVFTADYMLPALLPEAASLSLMQNQTYWVVTDLFPNSTQLMAYRRTGCSMFTFALRASVNISTASELGHAMAADAIGHYLKSMAGRSTFSLTAALSTGYSGVLGQLQFDVATRRNLDSQLGIVMTSSKFSNSIEFGLWSKRNGSQINLIQNGLTNKLPNLRVLAFMREPFIMNSATEYYGFCIGVLTDISNGLFDWDIVPVEDFSDLLPMLSQGVGDLIANPMQLPLEGSPADLKVSYSSWPLMYTSVAAVGYAESASLDFLGPLNPFSWNVWLAVIVAFVILSATLYSTDKISPNDYRRPKFSISESVFFVYSSFMMSKLRASAIKPSSRIFVLILWFASLMYCTTYGTNAFFMLIRSNRGLPFATLGELYNQSDRFYRVAVQNSTSVRILAAQPVGSVYKKLAVADVFVDSESDAMALVKNQTVEDGRRPVFIGDGAANSYTVAKSCDLKMTQSDELHRPMHLAMRTGLDAGLRRAISSKIQAMSDHGVLDQYQDTYWSAVKCSSNDNLINVKDLHAIRIEQVAGIFIVLACALGLSFVVLLLEYAVHQLQLYWHRMKVNSRLDFMTPYRAEVTSVTPQGVYIRVQGWKEFLSNQMLSPDPNKKMSAADLQIRNGDSVEVVYLGNDPKSGERLFRRTG